MLLTELVFWCFQCRRPLPPPQPPPTLHVWVSRECREDPETPWTARTSGSRWPLLNSLCCRSTLSVSQEGLSALLSSVPLTGSFGLFFFFTRKDSNQTTLFMSFLHSAQETVWKDKSRWWTNKKSSFNQTSYCNKTNKKNHFISY